MSSWTHRGFMPPLVSRDPFVRVLLNLDLFCWSSRILLVLMISSLRVKVNHTRTQRVLDLDFHRFWTLRVQQQSQLVQFKGETESNCS